MTCLISEAAETFLLELELPTAEAEWAQPFPYLCVYHDRATYTIQCDVIGQLPMYAFVFVFTIYNVTGSVPHTLGQPASTGMGCTNGSNVPPMGLYDLPPPPTPKACIRAWPLYVFVGIVARHFCALSMSWCLSHVQHRFGILRVARVDRKFAAYGEPKAPFGRLLKQIQMFVQISLYIFEFNNIFIQQVKIMRSHIICGDDGVSLRTDDGFR